MRTEKEIQDMIGLLNTDIDNYQQLHEKAMSSMKCKENFPRYQGEFKNSVLMFKAQRQILQWVLGEDFG